MSTELENLRRLVRDQQNQIDDLQAQLDDANSGAHPATATQRAQIILEHLKANFRVRTCKKN